MFRLVNIISSPISVVSLHQFPPSACTMERNLQKEKCTALTPAGSASVAAESHSARRSNVPSWSVITSTSQKENAALSVQVINTHYKSKASIVNLS